MADTTALKNRIRAAIKANDNQEITGPVLQQALLDMVDELNGATETEASARQSGDNTLQQGINTERQARIDADNALGQRITGETQRAQEAELNLQNTKLNLSDYNDTYIDLVSISPNANSDYDFSFGIISSTGNYRASVGATKVSFSGDGTWSAYYLSSTENTYTPYSINLDKTQNLQAYVIQVPLWGGLAGKDFRDLIYVYDPNGGITDVPLNKKVLEYKNKNIDTTLQQAVRNLRDAGYAFGGIAVTETNPGVPSGNCFYITRGAGTYAYFKNADNESIILENDGLYVLTYESVENNYWEYNLIIGIDNRPEKNSLNIAISKNIWLTSAMNKMLIDIKSITPNSNNDYDIIFRAVTTNGNFKNADITIHGDGTNSAYLLSTTENVYTSYYENLLLTSNLQAYIVQVPLWNGLKPDNINQNDIVYIYDPLAIMDLHVNQMINVAKKLSLSDYNDTYIDLASISPNANNDYDFSFGIISSTGNYRASNLAGRISFSGDGTWSAYYLSSTENTYTPYSVNLDKYNGLQAYVVQVPLWGGLAGKDFRDLIYVYDPNGGITDVPLNKKVLEYEKRSEYKFVIDFNKALNTQGEIITYTDFNLFTFNVDNPDDITLQVWNCMQFSNGDSYKMGILAAFYDTNGDLISYINGDSSNYDIETWVTASIPANTKTVRAVYGNLGYSKNRMPRLSKTSLKDIYAKLAAKFNLSDYNNTYIDVLSVEENNNNDYDFVFNIVSSTGNYRGGSASSGLRISLSGSGQWNAYYLSSTENTYTPYSVNLDKTQNLQAYIVQVPLWGGLAGKDFRDLIYVYDPESMIMVGVPLNEAIQDYKLNKKAEEYYNRKFTINILGDSITEQNQVTNALASLGYTINNYGDSGTVITPGHYDSEHSFVNRYASMTEDCDAVVVWGGANDYSLGIPLGSFETITSAPTTFYGALHTLFGGLKDKYLNGNKTIPVLILTPMHQYFDLEGYDSSHEYDIVDGNLVENKQGDASSGYLRDYIKAIKEVAAFYSIPVIDTYSECGFTPIQSNNKTKYSADGLHPNAAGGSLIANLIDKYLRLFLN